MTPFSNQFRKHSVRSQLIVLSQSSVDRELVVRHSHINLVRLHVVDGDRLQFCGRNSVEESSGAFPSVASIRRKRNDRDALGEDRETESDLGVGDESLQIGFRDGSDRVDIGTRAIVFGQVASQTINNESASCTKSMR